MLLLVNCFLRPGFVEAEGPASEPYGPENLLATVMHTMFDTDKLRVSPELLPPEITRLILDGQPIKELF